MSARMPLALLGVVAIAGAIGWSATRERAFEPAFEGRPPNILFLSIDTLRADHMGVYGYERNTTPNLDAWAKDATVFDNAQASASWTLPGLATVLTSYFTSTHRCWTFNSRLDPSFPTLPEILRDAGYDTMCVTSHVFLARRYGLQQGFVHFDDEFAHPIEDHAEVVTSHMVSDKGLRFLEQKAATDDDTPWLLWLHYFDPHGQYVVHDGITEEFGVREEVDRYDGEIKYTDLHLGRVLDKLEELDLDENTLVVFFSDHGEEFMEHGGLRHGHALYQELIRVPLIIKAPGGTAGHVEELVRTVDILPTVLDFVPPLAPPGDIEGFSLMSFLQGEGGPADLSALTEIRLEEDLSFDGVMQGRWKLIINAMTKKVELYDTIEDPLELTDVASSHPAEVEQLTRTLDKLIRRAKRRASNFDQSELLGLTDSQREQMESLGYIE